MPPKRGGPPRRGGRGNHSSNEQSRDTPSSPSQRESASPAPEFYGQPDDTPSTWAMHQDPGPGFDTNDPAELDLWNVLRARDQPDTVDNTQAGGASSAGNAEGPPVQGSDVVGEGDEIAQPLENRDRDAFPGPNLEQGTSQPQGSTNVAQAAGISNTQDPQPAQSNSDQISNIQGAREETPARGPPPPPFNTPEAPLQIPRGESSSPTPTHAPRAVLDDTGISPETPSPASHTSTPPAPDAGGGPRYQSGRDNDSPVGRDDPDATTQAPPAPEAADEAEDAQSPDFPRASIERETPVSTNQTEAREEANEELEETVDTNNGTEVTEDHNGKARRKRSGAPSPSPDEDDIDGVNGEPPKKRRKDDKDDDRSGDSASTAAIGSVPQFDGPGESDEDDFPTLQESNSRSSQQQNSRTTQVPGEQRQHRDKEKIKRRDLLKYHADREDYRSMRPKREKVSRIATPELEEEIFLETEREDHMGEGGSKKGKMQGYTTKFDRDWIGQQKEAGGQNAKKQQGESQNATATKDEGMGKVDTGDHHDDQPRSMPSSKVVPQFDGAGDSGDGEASPRTAMGKATNAIKMIDRKKQERLDSNDKICGLLKQAYSKEEKQMPRSTSPSKNPTSRKNPVKLDPAKDMPYMRTSKTLYDRHTILKPSESRQDQLGEGKGTWKELMQQREENWAREEEQSKKDGGDAADC